jgi:hypothetical protein
MNRLPTEATSAFIDQWCEACGIESMGTLSPIASSTYEFATLVWAEWFSTRRVPELLGCGRPAEYEERYHEQAQEA